MSGGQGFLKLVSWVGGWQGVWTSRPSLLWYSREEGAAPAMHHAHPRPRAASQAHNGLDTSPQSSLVAQW